LSKFGDALGGCNDVTHRFPWRSGSTEFADAFGGRNQVTQNSLGGCDGASLEMHVEAKIQYLR
jgi:hypothetical protein